MHDRDRTRVPETFSFANSNNQHLSAAGLQNYGDVSPIMRHATSGGGLVDTPPAMTSEPISTQTTFNPALFQPQTQTRQHFVLSPSYYQHHSSHSTPLGGAYSMASASQPMHDGLMHGSPQDIYVNLPPRRSGELGYTALPSGISGGPSGSGNTNVDSHNIEEGRGSGSSSDSLVRKRKRGSMPLLPPPAESGSSGSSSSGFGMLPGLSKSSSNTPALPAGFDDELDQDGKKAKGKQSGSNAGINPGLTSCEACRKGKRRCEPSPLVPPSHPDAAKLPCARCRRFALECVRVKITRRKGPAPVDLSAISDAVHGYNGEGSAPPSSEPSTATTTDAFGAQRPRPHPQQPSRQSSSQSHQALPEPSTRSASLTSPAFPLLAISPSLSTTGHMPESLDHVVSGSVIDNIINLFFDYVYPLTPCLHRPTFVANLTARRDKTDPLFFALVLTVLASTLVQVPRSLVNLDKTEVESLARRCVRVARVKVAYIYEEPVPVTSTFIVICYLEGIVHLLLGNNTAHVVATAQANQLALAMRLNEETSYEGLDPIESEIRRRIYWLLFQADKSTACLRARTICLRLEDAASLSLPTEVDDEQITSNGILPQPIGKTPLISGFNINTNLFRILNDALLLQRRRATPTVDTVLADLQTVNGLRDKVMQTTLEVADPLQLRTAYDSRVTSPSEDWESKLQERFLNYFQAPSDSAHALNSFLVMQGNILVTQYLVRLVLLQAREDLLAQLALLTQMQVHGGGGMAGLQSSEAPEDIACELLDGLNSLPVECVATNGPSLVQKVRFVAIQLMECSTAASPTAARAQRLLMQFLSVLGVIEGMYTFGRDISAE